MRAGSSSRSHIFTKTKFARSAVSLGVPDEFLERHPFPGPGLAIRCLCSHETGKSPPLEGGWLVPVKSVGVQGDMRSYRAVLAIKRRPGRRD